MSSEVVVLDHRWQSKKAVIGSHRNEGGEELHAALLSVRGGYVSTEKYNKQQYTSLMCSLATHTTLGSDQSIVMM